MFMRCRWKERVKVLVNSGRGHSPVMTEFDVDGKEDGRHDDADGRDGGQDGVNGDADAVMDDIDWGFIEGRSSTCG